MKLSIVIPALNEEAHIRAAIEHAWRLSPAEVIVVDGHSTDKTVEICRSAQCTVIDCRAGRGPQLNAGAAVSTGDIILFLHADSHLEPSASRQIEDIMTDKEVEVGGFCQQIDAESLIYRWLEWGNAWRLRRRGLAFGDQGIFIRRRLFERIGGFPDVPIMEDLMLMKHARRVSKPVLLPGPLHISARRWQEHGVVRQTLRNWYLQLSHALGASPEKLAAHYPAHSENDHTNNARHKDKK